MFNEDRKYSAVLLQKYVYFNSEEYVFEVQRKSWRDCL